MEREPYAWKLDGRRRFERALWMASALLTVAAAAALVVDIPLARWCQQNFSWACSLPAASGARGWQREVAWALRSAEWFGHGFGVVVISLVIVQLVPKRRWAIPRIMAVAFGSGLLVDVLKLTIARTRPHSFPLANPDATVWDTFGSWLPLGGVGSEARSLPSGHAGTAVGLAIALVWLFPRGRWLFPLLAALVACQRVQSGAHWLSDVLAGAAVACTFSLFCLGSGPISHALDRWERQWMHGRKT